MNLQEIKTRLRKSIEITKILIDDQNNFKLLGDDTEAQINHNKGALKAYEDAIKLLDQLSK